MAGETQRMQAVKELGAESKLQDEGTAVEQQSDKTTKESSEHFSSTDTDARASSRGPKLDKIKKERGGTHQREAVIRPQQTGKIDFRSLQNRSKFATDRTWSSGKGSPQSPSGKGRGREKSKRSGKAERGNPQHLYSLSITNPRSNLNIGIAYPQQKVSPATKLDTGRGLLSGSYRFHTPSIPEREVDIQQEELNYSRCFQEASSNLTSPSYTSQALGSSSGTLSHQHLSLSQKQQPATMENSNAQSGSQLILTDFQLNASTAWQSPERTFNGANYASSQKSTAHTDANKTNTIVPGSFQYGYNFLEESTSDSFPCEQNPQSQDFTDSSHSSVHGTHNSFSFLPVEGPNVAQNSMKFSNEQQPESRSSYPHTQQSQFIQGAASIQCPRNLSEDSASSDSSTVSISQQSDHGKSALPESTDNVGQVDGKDSAITTGIKRNCQPKDTTANQRTHIQASVHHTRNISHSQGTQMHFLNKTLNNSTVNHVHTGSVQFDKNINHKVLNGLTHSWEGPSKTFLPVAQNTIQYSDLADKFQFQHQSAPDKRIHLSKDNRVPWQQIRPATSNQNQLSRQISNQKLSYIAAPSEWQDDCKSQKNSSLKTTGSFPNSRSSEGFCNQRQEAVKQVSTFKVEMSHAQLCESKNKAIYFGLNQSIPVSSSRSYSYPPLQVPPMGLMMVSPYESPLPSPSHTPASSSTCSSLSPASTSPVNNTSEDSQMSKSGASLPFYQQPAQSKTQLPPDHLNTHPHQFHAEAQRNLPYAPDRDKDNMMSYLQSNTHPKTIMDGSKGYMDNFGMEHHQPPPPYSAHQLFATSLANANLDQLDVLLTCKQCDQNFNNVASFLGHKQYCTQPNVPKIEDSRKFHTEPTKAVSSASNVSMSKCPSDLHLSLLGLNKNGELISDSEAKADCRDDPMKLNLFSGSGNLPVPLPELEMEDAKLDSLITEALNGLGYQSDNAEIDSSFIDAFVDDDLNTVKATNKQCLKTKESVLFENKAAGDSGSSTQEKYFYNSNRDSPKRNKPYSDNKFEKTTLSFEHDKKTNMKKETSPKNPKTASREKMREQESKVKEARKPCKSEDESTGAPRFLLSSKFSERCAVKSFQDNSAPMQTSTSPTSRTTVKESKRRSTGGGTWSKELIHKIVQQKNKLHKLHVKGSKNLQFSLVMERLTPTVQNPAFGEYDYVSDTDDECEPVKIASQGRLNQSSRCKYTYTKECKWRARSERDQAAWRHESKECFEVKKSEEISLSPEKHSSQRHKRRGSRSSTSSELSTSVSVSSDSMNSPKSTDRIESDCEKKADIKKKDSPEWKSNESCSPQKSCKETGTLALTFTKSVKMCNPDKANIFGNKDGTENPTQSIPNTEIVDPMPSAAVTAFEKKSYSKSRETISQSKENTAALCENALESTDNLCHKEQEHSKSLQFHSHSPTSNKETDSNIDKGTKVKRKQRPHSTQSEVSGNTTFKEQSNSVCLAKEAITLVNELDTHKSASLCTSLMDEVCLSPSQSQVPLIQKDTLHLMPYTLDQDQGLMKSPLTFDTSSMFGDLAAFDNGLYSDMPKEGFHSLENTVDKKEEFVSSFSPFLEQRDWNLIVSPVLPDDISQYKGNFDKPNEKKPDYSDVPLSLPEKIIDYSANLNGCASEDELEIKRIVNELESQLQTTKMETPLTQEDPKQLQMSKFSPLRLSEESESDTTDAPVTSEPFTEPELPWSSPFQFDLVDRHHRPHSAIHSEAGALEHYTETEADASNTIIPTSELHNDRKPDERNSEKEIASETKDDVLEQTQYTENLMKSLEVMSDSLFKNEAIISEHREPNVTSPTSPQQESECRARGDPDERENHNEKKAISGKQNIFSPSNIKEQKNNIEFILKESQSSLPHSSDHTIDVHQQISSKPSEVPENDINKTEMEFISDGRVPEASKLIESSHCSSVVDSHADEDTNTDTTVTALHKNCDSPPHLTNSYEDAEANRSDQPLSVDICKSTRDVVKTGEQSTDSHLDLKNIDLLKCEQYESTSKNRHCLVKDHTVGPKPDLLVDIVTIDKPCSPILVESNTESTRKCLTFQDNQSIGQNSLLVLTQMESINDVDAKSYPCKAPQLNDSLTTEPSLAFNTIHKQEDILNVQDIREDLPVDFMASHQNSPCREHVEGDQCSFLHTYSPAIPLLATQPEMDKEESTQQSKFNSCVDPSSHQRTRSPDTKPEYQKEDCDETMNTEAEIEYSLIIPPHLELPSSDTSIHSPLPVSCTVEPAVLSEGLDKSDPSYGFKLSPLNNESNSDEPPQLTQYDYIPICNTVDVPVIDTSMHGSLKYTCFSLGLAAESQGTNSSADNVNEDMKVKTDPDNSIKLPMLRKVESSSFAVAESSPLGPQDISGCLTPQPPILCESGPVTDPGECLKTVTSPKTGQNNSQQGKVLCEICLMCFRTVPGLKRHKAMKHVVRNEKPVGPHSTTVCHQGMSLICEASEEGEKEHKDDSQPYRTKIDEMTETNSSLILKASETESNTEEMAAEKSAVAEDEIGNGKSVLLTKTKKNSKARKNKNNVENSKLDPFSDELLNILKTDLLQAITPDFKRNELQEQEQPERDGTETEKTLHCLTSNTGMEKTSKSPTGEINVPSETAGFNRLTDTDEIICEGLTEEVKGEGLTSNNVEKTTSVEGITTEHNSSRQSLCAAEEANEHGHSEKSLAQEIFRKAAVEVKCELNGVSSDQQHPLTSLSPPPRTPSGVSPDLKALLDDDTIFSQLFPRDEDAKRKKCPRVYGKRNKRQKLSSDSGVTQDCTPPTEAFAQDKTFHIESQDDKAFGDNQTNSCEYATISIDDTIMLNMCHNSALKVPDVKPASDGRPSVQEEIRDNTQEVSHNPLNPFQSTVDKTSIEWNGFNEEPIVTSDTVTCKADAAIPPGALPTQGDVYTVEQSVTDSGHSIDIQNINTTFQLPEIQFFDSNKDVSMAPPPASTDMENKDDEKSKKLTDRRGRKRQEGVIKVKDKQYKCKVCFTWFLTLGELNFHKLSHNPSPPPTCYMCVQRKFSSREQLRDHLWEKHAKNKTGIWTCGMCLKEISDVWMYNEHLREHATQFARRGQSQGSMLAIPGCFMQETAVKNFITSIMQHRPSKANRESSKATKEQEQAFAADGISEEGKTSDEAERRLNKPKSSTGRGGSKNTLTPLEVLHKTEAPKNVEMHPNCKDPSRDCHHCGKRFPKPFKLQRHLVVHNLEKIFLCHKCPVSYQEAQDLKEHLKRAHAEAGEVESKHTTLYTCELCADVMHVIKKSFICSTCNYTFSKKEQFDRHMEKHLSGGNKIFKFRGVHRPVKTSLSKEDECDSPASKKRRILSDSLQENSTDSGIASVGSLHPNQASETQTAKVSTLDDSTQTTAYNYRSDTNSTNVKTEDIAEDYSVLLVEIEKCISMGSSESAEPKEEEIEQTPAVNLDKEGNAESTAEPCDVKEEKESVCIRVETTQWPASQQNSSEREETTKANEDSASGDTGKGDSLPPTKDSLSSLREQQVTAKRPESQLAADVIEQQREDERHPQRAVSKQQASFNGAEQKDKACPIRTGDNSKSNIKATESVQVFPSKASPNTSASNEDKESQRPQKKKKDMKSPHSMQRLSFPATQENFGVDSQVKKKYHPSKCFNPSMQRKSEGPNDYAVLASVRDDVMSNKLVPKCKTSTLGLQLKRSLLDSCTPKKADMVAPLNREYKSKKGHVGRPLHASFSKVSSVPMNNSLNKSRPKQGVRSVESHSFRTAESQNHLLSQLFGQKLTSFKIPLRKDTSESIN
ncbi:zinc finger protein 469 [Dunckerocampus dactyliophorus]|uniref:zinc finger protein 469 n=1 Tax=Dunckerocampus dactyliophorus TaxID=161453 RepID=UPI0024056189|nr:zinc finger protein 469 [Dunckerocampus dactyliophorus]XP_054631286.1 zinc finger protein 469 [Dunckerocampus dactyliophorus]XP_054631287.1 zinc finger protein 469 [Dunckerocampus dactyliophorus]XP_054631288.1 zinc finger protein 469 [Dunckerocampus dactyliophorus]XP_054631289.1 zinc finger protein 469 [Dunckerocampus dactyliophorus]XP_054631290.1 zinc finger protein 469 [Dunckerocampus dactyliophorus]XP_054631291.1 zinc finger protein 469 [Dunckerocampus dactyliophorus]